MTGTPRLLRWSAVSCLLATVLVTWVATTRGLLNLLWYPPRQDLGTGFFWAQAVSLMSGRTSVTPAVIQGECFLVEGACVGYHGLGPSLLRLPILLLGGPSDNGLSTLFTFLAIVVGAAAALALLLELLAWSRWNGLSAMPDRRWPRTGLVLTVSLMVALAPGTLLLAVATPNVYHEAIAWAASLTLVAVWGLARWARTQDWRWLVLVLGAGLLAGHSRPNAAIAVGAVAAGLLLLTVPTRRPWASRGLLAGVAVLPLTTVLLVNMWKFGGPTPDLSTHETEGAQFLTGDGPPQASIAVVPTKLWAMVRPDGAGIDLWQGKLPTVRLQETLIVVPPTPAGWVDYEATGSLTSLAPLPALLTSLFLIMGLLTAGAWGRRRLFGRRVVVVARAVGSEPQPFLALAVTGALIGLVPTLTFYGLTNRYLVDAWPLLVLGGIAGLLWLLARVPAAAGWVSLVPWAAVPLALVSVVFMWSYALGQALPLSSPLPRLLPSLASQDVLCPRVGAWRPATIDGVSRTCIDVAEDREGLDDAAFAALASASSPEVRAFAAVRPAGEVLLGLARDPDLSVRVAVATNSALPQRAQDLLAVDDLTVAAALAANPGVLPAVQERLALGDVVVRVALAGNPAASPDVLSGLARSTGNVEVARALAANPASPAAALGPLAAAEDPETRLAVAQNPRTAPEALRLLSRDVNPDIARIAADRLAGG